MMDDLLKDKVTDQEELMKGLSEMAKAAGKMLKGDNVGVADSEPELTDSINDVLKNLNLNQENVTADFSGDQFASIFKSLETAGADGSSGGGGDGDAFMGLMHSMMQSLLSAEVLLPAMKEISDIYPGWLEANRSKLSDTDRQKYEKQLKIMQEVVTELEKEKPTDASDVRQARFTVILDKMQSMQDLGQPPEEMLKQCQGSGQAGLPMLDPAAMPGDCNQM